MGQIKVSVIIPVYNAEKYIAKCISTVIGQSLKEIEIILVDDGSTDSSLKIINKYKKEDARITVIHQKNQYAGVARNNGMKAAQGKYLLFLDSDDFFELNMLEVLYKKAEQHNADIVLFGNYQYSNITKTDIKVKFAGILERFQGKVVSPYDFGDELFTSIKGVPWNKFVKKEFVDKNNIWYQELRHNNDEYFNRMILAEARRIYVLNKRFVHYRVDNNQSLQGTTYKDPSCFGRALKKIYEELINRNLYNGTIKASFEKYINATFRYNISKAGSFTEAKVIISYIQEDLLPLFDISFPEHSYGQIIKDSKSPEEGLFELWREYYITRESREYRIGKKIINLVKNVRSIKQTVKR